MRLLRVLVFIVFFSNAALAQQIDEGLWNTGRAFSLITLNNDSLRLQNQLMLVQVYPGFTVVKSSYDILNTSKDSLTVAFLWRDTATTAHRFFQQLNNLSSAGMKVLNNNDTIPLLKKQDGWHFVLNLAPAKITTITTYQLCQTNQGKISAEGTVKEANAFVVSLDRWTNQGNRRIFVKLMTNITQTNIMGVYPQDVTGTMKQLKWTADSAHETMVIWYEGAAPDYKFETKVLPKQQLLFEDINAFDLALFDVLDFKTVSKNDFTSNKRSTLGTILYFVLFSVPWLILLGFIVFLLKKPKKDKNARE